MIKCDWCGGDLMLLTLEESGCEEGEHAEACHVTVEVGHETWSTEPGSGTEFCDHDCEGPDEEWDVCNDCKVALFQLITACKSKGGRP